MSAVRDDATAPLWRAAQAYRVLSWIYALGFQIAVNDDLERPGLAVVLFAVLSAWTAACAVAYLGGPGRRPVWVISDVVLTCALMVCTLAEASPMWRTGHQSVPTTLWATNAVISAGIQFGWVGGGLGAIAVLAASATAKGFVIVDLDRNAAVVIVLAVGLVVGFGTRTVLRAHRQMAAATRLAAATDERERLARQVHDGVLQVLALVARRGVEADGASAELARLAAQQEQALRGLLGGAATDGRRPTVDDDDLAARLRQRAGETVVVSGPAHPVVIPSARSDEMVAVVENALENVSRHAGPGAMAFVLLEDLGGEVVVTVRDDGLGFADGRLDAARRSGRLGVAHAIVGRMEAMGGRAVVWSQPGSGTEWEFTLPRVDENDA